MKIKFYMFFFVAILFLSCNRSASNNNVENSIVNEQNIVTEAETIDNLTIIYPIEETNSSWVECKTNILKNDVDARVYPSLDAEIIYQLNENDIVTIRGFSYDGKWVCVTYSRWGFNHAWVNSKNINIGDIEVTPLTFVQQEGNKTTFFYELKGEEIIVEYTDRNNDNLIIWGSHERGYHYSNVPGIYIVNRDKQELMHMTHFGAVDSEGANAWTRFMNNYTYLLQDFGTGPGIRGLTVWNLRDKKIAFQGSYYGETIINNHTIQYVHSYNEWNRNNCFIDEEIILYERAFMAENPAPEQEIGGLFVTLIIRCSLDLETGEINIIGAKYILTQ